MHIGGTLTMEHCPTCQEGETVLKQSVLPQTMSNVDSIQHTKSLTQKPGHIT